MQFDLKDLLQAIGPTVSLVFAAWIFLSFLESRYVTASLVWVENGIVKEALDEELVDLPELQPGDGARRR